MEYRLDLPVIVLTIIVAALELITALAGLLAKDLYSGNSVSMIAQGKGQDLVTAVIAVPATVIVLMFAVQGSFKAQLALAGLLGYFLYTYASYVFAWKFNNLFLAYTATFSGRLTTARPPAVYSSVLLVKGLTMGLAIISMTIFMARAGTPDQTGTVIFSVLTLLFVIGFVWVFVALKAGEALG